MIFNKNVIEHSGVFLCVCVCVCVVGSACVDEHVMYCEMGTELGLHVQMCLFVHALCSQALSAHVCKCVCGRHKTVSLYAHIHEAVLGHTPAGLSP